MKKKQTLQDFYNEHRVLVIAGGIIIGILILIFLSSSVETYRISSCDQSYRIEDFANSCELNCRLKCVDEGFSIMSGKNISRDIESGSAYCNCYCEGCKG